MTHPVQERTIGTVTTAPCSITSSVVPWMPTTVPNSIVRCLPLDGIAAASRAAAPLISAAESLIARTSSPCAL